MSDVSSTPAAVAVDPTPSTTVEVASEVLESLESAESSEPTGDDGGTRDTSETPAPAPVKTKPLSEAEQLLAEAGFTEAQRQDGRENWIPHSKVVKIIENGINQGKGAFGQKYQALETEATTLREAVGRFTPIAEALDLGPEQFLALAGQHDPRYKAFLEAKQAPPAAPPAADPWAEGMPAPDLDLGNGSKTYSLDGIKALMQHTAKVAKAEALREAEERIGSRIKPFEEQTQRQQTETALRERTSRTIDEAKTWPGFADHEADILKLLQADSAQAKAEGRRPQLTLEAAYRQAVLPKLAADRNAIREQVLAELKAQPVSTSVPRSGAEAISPNGGRRTTQDIAAATIARLSKS